MGNCRTRIPRAKVLRRVARRHTPTAISPLLAMALIPTAIGTGAFIDAVCPICKQRITLDITTGKFIPHDLWKQVKSTGPECSNSGARPLS